MSRNNSLIQGLLIMVRYNGLQGEVNAGFKSIYAGPEGAETESITEEDAKALRYFGWDFDESIERWYLD